MIWPFITKNLKFTDKNNFLSKLNIYIKKIMKHLLNDLSEEEKNRIREQHTGGKKIMIENFNKLVNTKLGDSKPLTEN